MRPTTSILAKFAVKAPKVPVPLYTFAPLSQVSAAELPNNGFGKGSYHIPKTKFKHWPVYLKVSNTRRTTEIRKIQGDIVQFKNDLLKVLEDGDKLKTSLNTTAGIVNIKGDYVKEVKALFDQHL
ncbi:54S ribosomal protein IMG2, mitochondrial [Candida viswanathii]|uniref:Large ribosomal subunit protein mL49 n=1 Tax=Candida viswanathii TaxID=5486 RepID=A0A367YLW3_9ASCO|nr:54S ribosomal protein IMG2, mitochondrial [Candida viswanathii]